jgi:peptidoglycan/xylan/chitin deacetylase (PgdA/CDA1 family)
MPLFNPFFRLPGRWTRRRARRTRMAIQILVIVTILVVVLPAYIIYKPPRFVINYFQSRFPEVLFHVQTTKKIVAMTIDDAPSSYTTELLDILKVNDAHATFFAIGSQVAGRENIMDEIVRQGHELGNHAMHDEPSLSLPSDNLYEQLQDVDVLISTAYRTVGVPRTARYFRPGSGFFSQRILDVAAKLNYKTVLGNVYPHDPFISWWRVNAWHVLSMVRPGSVIICHDRRSWTVPMLAKVVPEIRRRGFEVVSVSELLEAAGS